MHALKKAFEDMRFTISHVMNKYICSNWDVKFIKSNCQKIFNETYDLQDIQHSMWDFCHDHLKEFAHKDMMKYVSWYLKAVNMMNKYKTRFGFGKHMICKNTDHQQYQMLKRITSLMLDKLLIYCV